MNHPKVVSRAEWLAARLELLKAEKELTRRGDAVAKQTPGVAVGSDRQVNTDSTPTRGARSLADLFRGRSQILMYHFMFGPDYTAGCPACSAIADGFNGFAVHLANHDVMLWAISRAPLAQLQTYKRRMGWIFPWASSFGTDFNFDFNVSFTAKRQREGIEYNYEREEPLPETPPPATSGLDQRSRHDRHRCRHLHARAAGHERVPRSRTASSITRFRLCAADWTVCGALTNGWTAPRSDRNEPATSGGAGTTITISASDHPGAPYRWANFASIRSCSLAAMTG